MDLVLNLSQGHVHAIVSGTYSDSEIEPIFQKVRDFHLQHKIDLLLLDLREIQGNLSILERFNLGSIGAAHLMQFVRRAGVVVRVDQLDPDRIGLVVANNRGLLAEIFLEQKEAIAWLMNEL
jgi:hypothetical protein